MSESLDHEAPIYTVLEKRLEGTDIITTVIMDGEVQEFVVSRGMIEALKDITRLGDESDE